MTAARKFNTESLQRRLDAWNDGDENARNELIAFSRHSFQKLASRQMEAFGRLRPHVETDDLLQNSLIRLNAALSQITVTEVGAYLALSATLVRNEAVDLSRKLFGPRGIGKNEVQNHPIGADSSGDDLAQDRDSDPSPFTLVASQELWERFQQTVEELPRNQRQVFDLRWTHRLSQGEVARALQLSEKAVYKRWLKVKSALGQIIGELDSM